jgi:4-amino-4-deoxy-L-arabinose transferase-like glycosyltransferase
MNHETPIPILRDATDAPDRAIGPNRNRYAPVFIALLVGLAGLAPRLFGLADFLTTDEAYHWITRTERFAAALAAGRWGDTLQTGHPGVTVMWLGSLGLQLERLALASGWIVAPDRLEHLAWLRIGPALAHAFNLSLGYLLLRRLLDPTGALLAGLLWAGSPYLVAHGRLLHLDALLTDFVMLTILSALCAVRAARALPWLGVSGIAMGLALLTKGPALITLPFVGLMLFTLAPRKEHTHTPVAWFRTGLAWSIPRYLLWLGIAVVVVLMLWPALWIEPGRAFTRYTGEIIDNGGRPNGAGQFFLGSNDRDPGPLFYPVAGAFRLTPLESLGLIALGWSTITGLRRRRFDQHTVLLLTLAAFVLFWTLVMTLGPKKFDRYTLPTWPALLVLSACGLRLLGMWIGQRLPSIPRPGLWIGLLLLIQGGQLAWYHPYYLSYYNPLLGGGPAAERSLLIGWGEGMDQVGAWLSAQPDIGYGQVISALRPTLQPFVPVPVQEIRAIDSAVINYAVVYLESIQRGDAPEIYARIQQTVPVGRITIHGIEYARIYQLPRPFETALPAAFGASLHLHGYTLERIPGQLTLTPAFDVRDQIDADYMLFAHLYAADGTRVAQIDVPPGGASLPPTSQWRPGAQIGVPLPINLPSDLPAGDYTLVLGLYNPATGARLALSSGPHADAELAGPDALQLAIVTIVER